MVAGSWLTYICMADYHRQACHSVFKKRNCLILETIKIYLLCALYDCGRLKLRG